MNSKAHLIPIKKAVFDRRKGFILRTYYVRPEYIERIIRKFKGLEPEPKIKKFKPLPRVIDSIRLRNPLLLKDYFTSTQLGRESWNIIESRNILLDKVESTNNMYAIQRANLSILSYVLTNEKIFISGLRKEVKDGSTFYKYIKKENYKEFQFKNHDFKNNKNKGKVYLARESFNMSRAFRILEKNINRGNFLTEDLLRSYARKSKTPLFLNVVKPKYGYIKYSHKLEKVLLPFTSGVNISRFINLLLPHPIKVINILSKMMYGDDITLISGVRLSPVIDFKDLNIKEDKVVKLYPYILLDVLYNNLKMEESILDMFDILYMTLYLRKYYPDLYRKLSSDYTDSTEYFIKKHSVDLIEKISKDNFSYDLTYIERLFLALFILPEDMIHQLFSYIISTSDKGRVNHVEYLHLLEGLFNRPDIRVKDIYKYFKISLCSTDVNLHEYGKNVYKRILEGNYDFTFSTFIDISIPIYMRLIRPTYIPIARDIYALNGSHLITTVIPRIFASVDTIKDMKENVLKDLSSMINAYSYRGKVYIPIFSDQKSDYQYIRYLKPIEVALKEVPQDLLKKDNIDFIEIDISKYDKIKAFNTMYDVNENFVFLIFK